MTESNVNHPKRPKMLQADFEEFMATKERQIGRTANPIKRHQPKVTRHESARQSHVLKQQIDPIKSIYQDDFNQTPVADDDFVGTKEVGPGDVNNAATNWRTGNMTVEPKINGNKTEKVKLPKKKGEYVKQAKQTSAWGAGRPSKDITSLAAKFMK